MKTLYTLIFLQFSVFVFGQTKQKIKFKLFTVGEIPNAAKFKKMNKYELRLDSLNNELIQEMDSMINLEKVFEPSYQFKATPKEKREVIEQMRAKMPAFGKNRSRYYFQYYKNNKIDTEALKGFGDFILNSPCDCILSNDTIQVRMGIWVFGGFGFPVDIVGNKFNSQYIDDKHDKKVYKLNLNDTLNYAIVVNNNQQNLILKSKPNFTVGQSITGYLSFQTDKFYRSNDENYYALKEEYSDKNMDLIYLKGHLYFKCIVREKLKDEK